MLLARSLLAGSLGLTLAWALLVGVVFEDPSLLRDRDDDAADVTATLAAAIEEIELLRGEVAALQGPDDVEAPSAAAAAAAPTPVVAAAAPSEVVPLPIDAVAGISQGGPYSPAPGEFLEVDLPRMHRVAIGESASSIAEHYGTTVEELVAFNALRNPDVLRLGTLLRIP